MTDDGPDSKTPKIGYDTPQQAYDVLEARLAKNIPLVAYDIDVPFTANVGSQGDITLDCPCLAFAGHDRAGILRLRLTPAAAGKLREALSLLERIQGAPPVVPSGPKSH